jgi:hypothetical protein
MYFSSGLILNSGPISCLELKPSFDDKGLPKPLILVGTNGSGKTGALSTIADALAEIAAQHFQDVLPQLGAGHSYFRVLGGRNLRLNQPFELSALKFTHGNIDYFVRAKAGTISSGSIPTSFTHFNPMANLALEGSNKTVEGDNNQIANIFGAGAYVFFPSSRFEIPHWANKEILERNPEWDFNPHFSNRLEKPIVVQSSLQELKPWFLDVISEQLVDFHSVLFATDLAQLQASFLQKHAQAIANASGVSAIVSKILGQEARMARLVGGARDRKVCIASGSEMILPSIDHLSAGQSSLLSIFGTIAMYGNVPRIPIDRIEGIAIVDEIDDHLHADLQHEALPQLMKLFPRMQFIVSSHAPLFLLGMRKVFGDDGFTMIELPSGITIGPERFSEFETSFAYFRATQSFDAAIQEKVRSSGRPLVLTEGQTDPQYLKTACELLGFDDLADQIEFDWVGAPAGQGAQGGGKTHLDDALKFLTNNPQFQIRKVLFLYDPETKKPPRDEGNLHVRTLPQNINAKRQSGIENLLPDHVFEDQFFETKIMGKGDDKGPVPFLQKTRLCESLCGVKRDHKDFEAFRHTLEIIRSLLLS